MYNVNFFISVQKLLKYCQVINLITGHHGKTGTDIGVNLSQTLGNVQINKH